jgi:RNA polymerase sigma-70 factor, ECF subfamily
LRSGGQTQALALADLHGIILTGLPYALRGWLAADHPEFDTLAEEVAQETLLCVLDRPDTFEGRSQFTTSVHKIAVRLALTELRRRRWKDVSLDQMAGDETETVMPGVMEDSSAGPGSMAERQDMLTLVNRLMMEALTDKQRQAMMAIAVQGMPLEAVARRMGMQRNAVYRLMHDARKRLKQRLEAMGLPSDALVATFEKVAR